MDISKGYPKWDDIKDKDLVIQVIKGREIPMLYDYPYFSIEYIAKKELDMSEHEFLKYATADQCELFKRYNATVGSILA